MVKKGEGGSWQLTRGDKRCVLVSFFPKDELVYKIHVALADGVKFFSTSKLFADSKMSGLLLFCYISWLVEVLSVFESSGPA